jgi:multicomponent Na+:H+ antiporter subunit D
VPHLTVLTVAVPLLAAAALVAIRHMLPRTAYDWSAGTVAVATLAMCALLLAHAAHHGPFTYWLGGWRPVHGVSLGISLSIDPIGAGLATYAALLVTAALVYSWRYFESMSGLYHALMLVFLAAMVGFSLTGDLFNLVVFFELMSITAYALTAYQIEERGPIQGAINFAISNSVGACAIVTGVALLYARTGALNMAQIGATLDRHGTDPLVLVSMALLFTGFLTKAAAVPLHFWLADAYAVAPTPVCVLFAGVMTELGVYAIARLYWTIFAGPLGPHADALRAILVAIGTATAIWGAVMCFAQRHIKRMLAFSTISDIGMFVCGVGLLSGDGLAGTAVYVIGQGLVKAALFMLAGILMHRFGSVDEFDLHGRGRGLVMVGVLFVLGGVVMSAVPGATPFFGKSLLDGASLAAGYPWLPSLFVLVSIFTGGAALRIAGRVFLGWGPDRRERDERQASRADAEEDEAQDAARTRTPPLMILVPVLLLAASLAIGLIPGAVPAIEQAAGRFRDHAGYLAFVLHDHHRFQPVTTTHVAGYDYLYGAVAAVGAVLIAAVGLWGRPLRRWIPDLVLRPVAGSIIGLRRLHSGHIGDYIAWWTAGAALLGGSSLIFLR